MKRSASSKLEIRSQTPNARTKFRQFSPSQRTLTFESPEKNLRPDKISGLERIVSPYRPFSAKLFFPPNAMTTDRLKLSSTKHGTQSIFSAGGETRPSFRTVSTMTYSDRPDTNYFDERKKERGDISPVKNSHPILGEFKKELNNIQFEKRHLKQLISTLNNQIQDCKETVTKKTHEQESWHNKAVKLSRGIEVRTNEKYIIDHAKEIELAQVIFFDNDIQAHYQKNTECIANIETEKNHVLELQNVILQCKRVIAAFNREKEKLRIEVSKSAKLSGQLEQKYTHLMRRKQNLQICAEEAKTKASSLKKDMAFDSMIPEGTEL